MPRARKSSDQPTPLLTVVMPVHCAEQWIETTLDSVAAEAGPDIEILVIDGSPDGGTAHLVGRYADRLSLELVARTDLSDWRTKTNFGVERARAQHVCTLHQDDLWLPGRITAVREWIRSGPEAAMHLAPTAIIDCDGKTLGTWRCPLPANGAAPSPMVLERLLVQNFVAIPSPVFRRDAWLACGGLDLELWYTADWDMWLKLAAYGPVHYHDQVTAAFRVHGSSLTMTGSGDPAEFEDQMRIVLDRHLERHPECRTAAVARVAQASIKINVALAAASAGSVGGFTKALAQILGLGPSGLHRYLRDSRLIDRVLPRLRARLSGAL
jgi:hypothetical protein